MPGHWYSGQAVVHIKDQALQPSTPLRHAAELLTTLQLENSEDVKVRTQCNVYICPYACTFPYASASMHCVHLPLCMHHQPALQRAMQNRLCVRSELLAHLWWLRAPCVAQTSVARSH